MHAKDVIRNSLDMGEMVIKGYLNDLSDDDMRLVPVAGMNPIAWQFGHIVSSERTMIEAVKPGSCPPLPEGFDDAHATAAPDRADGSKYLSKTEYLRLWDAQRAATKAVLDGLSDDELDRPSEEKFKQIAPTAGLLLNLAGQHPMMHSGQFVTVRRMLNKPIAI